MSVPPEKIPPLPKVAAPPGWSWYYFRMHYLPALASGLVVVTAAWLWAANLPELTSVDTGLGAALPVEPTSTTERQAVTLVNTNMPDLQTAVTNGNLGLGGGL